MGLLSKFKKEKKRLIGIMPIKQHLSFIVNLMEILLEQLL